jgi:cytochrome c oxidase subunit 1
MHYVGITGQMRRLYDPYQYGWLKPLQGINEFITVSAIILGAAQLLFFVNYYWSAFAGKRATENPWNSNGLEWTTPSAPPHGNWPGEIPTVYRWPYEYGTPDAPKDHVMQHEPPLPGEHRD